MTTHSIHRVFYHPLSWILLYLSIHFLIRILFSQTLQVDDAEQIEHAQLLTLGYPFPQPPLYSWISWGLFQLFGTGLFALTLLKYSLIAVTGWLTWQISGYLFQHQQSRWLALSAYLLMPSFAWHMHQGFTHTILLGFSIVLSLHALLRLHSNPKLNNYLYLGFALGVGLLSKYSFLLFLILILLASLTIPSYRQVLLSRYSLATIALFLLVITPHGIWLIQHYADVFGAIDQKLQATHEATIVEQLRSLGRFTTAAIAFITPLSIIYLASHGKQIFTHPDTTSINQQLLNRFYIFLIVIVITLALFTSMPHFKVRWFHPLMMIFPLWLLGHIENRSPHPQSKIRWITYSTIALTTVIFVVRLLQVSWGPELGHYGRLNRPIVEALNQLPDSLIKSGNTLVTDDGFLGSHLLTQYHETVIIIQNNRYGPPSSTFSKSCLWLWDDDANQPSPTWQSPPIETGKVTLPVAEFSYTLSYAVVTHKDCPLF